MDKKDKRIAELEAELEAVKHDKEGWYNADGYAEIVKRLEAQVKHLHEMHDFNESQNVALEAENQRLRDANFSDKAYIAELKAENYQLQKKLEYIYMKDMTKAKQALEVEG